MKKIFRCPALELFHCLPLWKTVLFVSSRAFSLSTPTFSLSTPVENSEATWKKATKCNKLTYPYQHNFPKMLVFQIVTNCPPEDLDVHGVLQLLTIAVAIY